MAEIRDMQLLVALARHRHFARAADDCGISQPAFSARIRNLELELGVPIVQRGNRFQGFTDEGETVLKWARRVLSDADGLKQELELAKGQLTGRLSVGVVPTALPYIARVPAILRSRHPGLSLRIYSETTGRIHQGLADYSLDAGIGYLEGTMPKALAPVEFLYEERYVVIAAPDIAPRKNGKIAWAEAVDLPLCLLTLDMRNRRFLNEIFENNVGRAPAPVLETNSTTILISQVERGISATIAPAMLADEFSLPDNIVRLPLEKPEVTTPIGLLLPDRQPTPPSVAALAQALRDAAR